MAAKLFVNLPVKDLKRSMEFFKKLGYSFNPQFTDNTAACMVISEENSVMLLTEKKFQGFTTKAIADTKKVTEVLIAVSTDSRRAVDEVAKKAVGAGGREARNVEDLGFMYQRAIEDLDGHTWEFFWFDPAAIQGTQAAPTPKPTTAPAR
ncbi:MAG TPA: VOC family protein [Candidatus Thermoplasmatota archaeon]